MALTLSDTFASLSETSSDSWALCQERTLLLLTIIHTDVPFEENVDVLL
ncbi:Uncharacterised protein [Yersinia enterocolitica]|nr:Uncharacterised protein [Yersinia enterocolitica]